jgi:hypothetical protein
MWTLRGDGIGNREAPQVKEMAFPWPKSLTVEVRVRPQVSPCEILAAKSDTETDYIRALLCQCHSTNAVYLRFISLPPVLLDFTSLERP